MERQTELAEKLQTLTDKYRKQLGALATIEEIESNPKFIEEKKKLIKKYNKQEFIMNSSNLKDKLTSYAAILFSIATAIMGLPATLAAINASLVFSLPPIVNVICGYAIALSVVVALVLQGKNPDGSTKTPEQVIKQNKEAKLL